MAAGNDRPATAPGSAKVRGLAAPGALPRRREVVLVLGLVLLTCAAFWRIKDADFVNYDDPLYVTGNAEVLKGLHPRGLVWALTSFAGANWHPLTWISHMLDVTLFGLRAGPHHLVSLAMHSASACLLFLLLEGLTGARWPSLLTAAFFAVHPLRVESVAWISERKDVLSVLLGMLTLLAYLRYVRRPVAARFAPVVVLFCLGLMSKPMLVTLPLALLLLDWWPLGRFHHAARPGAIPPAAAARRLFLEKAPLLGLAATSCVVTFFAQRLGGAMSYADVFPMGVRFNNAIVSYVRYLGKMLWPRQLIPFYPHPGLVLSQTQVILCFALLAGITVGAFASRRRHPWFIAGWLWYLGMLVPVIGLVQVGLQGMADRYSYLPLVGLFVAICWESYSRALPSARGRVVGGAGAVCVVITLALLTWNQSGYWKDTVTLFNRVIAVDPRNFLAYNMLGSNYLVLGDPVRAKPLFRRSLELKSSYAEARYNLGLALARLGEREEAIATFTAVIRANPKDEEGFFNRGRLLLEQGKAEEALRDFDAARALAPAQMQIHYRRGLALARLERYDEAAAAFAAAAALAPQNVEAIYNQGRALDAAGSPEEAIACYRAALGLKPDFAEAHNMLGVVLAERGRLSEALGHFSEAVRLAPLNIEARANLERARQNRERSR